MHCLHFLLHIRLLHWLRSRCLGLWLRGSSSLFWRHPLTNNPRSSQPTFALAVSTSLHQEAQLAPSSQLKPGPSAFKISAQRLTSSSWRSILLLPL
jgi:hypothetical protein